MISKPTGGKRGRPKRKVSDNQDSNEQFSQKKNKKIKKLGAPESLKKIQSQAKKKKEKIYDFNSDQDDGYLSEQQGEQQRVKVQKIVLEPFNSDKVFAEILNRANKQPQFLIMLKNLLSGSYRNIKDQKNQLNKKWKQLRNSNCTQNQYLTREAQLKRIETQQIKDLQQGIMMKLSQAGIKGFQSRDYLIEKYKNQHNIITDQYRVDQASWNRFYEEQTKLLNLLMKQNDFVSQDYNPSKLIKSYSQPVDKTPKQNFIPQGNEMDLKLHLIQNGQNPQAAQFLFCKHYKDINYDKVFDNSNGFKIHQNEKFYMNSKALSWLLQSKCDEIYTNQKFQKETYDHYFARLRQLYSKPNAFEETQIMNEILEATAYVLNSVHYYQKFKLKCQLLHPLDLLLVVEKLVKDRENIPQENAPDNNTMQF